MSQIHLQSYDPGKPICLVTGSSGLIGQRVADILAPDYHLVGLDVAPPNDETAFPGDWIEADLTDAESVAFSLRTLREHRGNKVASVIHLAAYYDFSGEPSPLYNELTVEGTRRLLRGLHEFEVEQFVFSSSLLVMHPCDIGERLTETSPTRAEWSYPQSKLDAEQVIHETRDGIPTVILRIAGVYDDECHSIPIARQIARIYEQQMESYVFPGNLDAGNPYIHLDDVASCIRAVVENRHQLGEEELFLVAEPEVVSYGEMQEQLGQLIHGSKWTTIRIPKAVAKAGAWAKEKMASDEQDEPFIKPWMIDMADDHYAVDIAHIQQKVGWSPTRKLSRQLKHMVASLHANPERWYRRQGLPLPETVESRSHS